MVGVVPGVVAGVVTGVVPGVVPFEKNKCYIHY